MRATVCSVTTAVSQSQPRSLRSQPNTARARREGYTGETKDNHVSGMSLHAGVLPHCPILAITIIYSYVIYRYHISINRI